MPITKNESGPAMIVDPAVLPRLSDVLSYLAGDFAPDIARVWPHPHPEFFGLPADRRHLAAMIFATDVAKEMPPEKLRELIEDRRRTFKSIADELVGELVGLRGVLRKLGAKLVDADAYRSIHACLQTPEASKVIRHFCPITKGLLDVVQELPNEFRRTKIVEMVNTIDEAIVIRRTTDPARGLCGVAREPLAAILEAIYPDRARFWLELAESCSPWTCKLPETLADPRLRPIMTARDIASVAVKYRNCLRIYTADARDGSRAFIEWLGEPNAVIEIRPCFGRVGSAHEIKGVGNERIRPRPLRQILKALEASDIKTDYIDHRRLTRNALARLLARIDGDDDGSPKVTERILHWMPTDTVSDDDDAP